MAAILTYRFHIKTTLASGPTNVRSMRPIPFPSVAQCATRQYSATGTNDFDCGATWPRTEHIRPPVPALFLANFRFAGILVLPRVIYHFLFLIRFTGFFVAFPGGRPLLRFGCAISGAFRAISAGFCSIGWLHQKNVPVPVL